MKSSLAVVVLAASVALGESGCATCDCRSKGDHVSYRNLKIKTK